MSQPWQDKEVLVELYQRQGLTMQEIADHLGCSKGTIHRWMRRHDIESKKQGRASGIMLKQHVRGYEYFMETRDGQTAKVYVHRLCALAWFGKVGEHVHHKNGVPWDNREENIKNMQASEHAKLQ